MNRFRIPVGAYTALLRRYLLEQRKRVLLLLLLLCAGIGLQLVNPQIIRYFIDRAQAGDDSRGLLIAAGFFIGVSLLAQALAVCSSYLGETIGWTATNLLRGDVAVHALKLDMSFHKSHTTGAIIERVDGDINNLANFFSNFVVTLLSNLLLVVGILVLLFREGWMVGSVMLLFVVFALLSIRYVRRFAVPYWGRMRQMSSDFYGFLGEHLEGTEDTRANGASGFVMRRYFELLRRWLPLRIRAFLGWASMWITTIVVFAIGNAAAFAVTAYSWRHGMMSLGTVYMIFYYTELMAKPIEKIRTQMEDLQKADASIARVRELLDTRSAIADGPGATLPDGALSVAFEHVRFGYEADGDTLRGIDFRLPRGGVLGLLGRTGSGKTTLARLLLRFYDVSDGRILLEGVDIRTPKLEQVRHKVGMVTQTVELFQGTLRDNLTFYDDRIPDDRIRDLLGELGLGDWLRSLPGGLETPLESGGGGLSAGEAQLISFARVFLTDPGLVILDEASSRLDPATERKIEAAITKLLQGRTCIIIAHRLATIERADAILILDEGEIAEFGPRRELAANPASRYSRMLHTGMEELLR
ncbi:ABC transporter ATP-binding protein [Paenibacillus cymbidii]|uniref:ABC transporter ATP-binding protein n=1 Tax=Paenibacillus cymbidii TaxID=1639034 RepID=UPI0010812920|nr:ABC transporter ATP-binding protein [Paenibacillus cymbidii]